MPRKIFISHCIEFGPRERREKSEPGEEEGKVSSRTSCSFHNKASSSVLFLLIFLTHIL